jgi:type IV pilus assembly protein PilX
MRHSIGHINCKNQNGAVLIVSLLFLLILTILGVSALNNSLLEQKMTSNMQDAHIAFLAAEAALRDGESMLDGQTLPDFVNENGFYAPERPSADLPRWVTIDWQSASAVRMYAGFANAPGNLSRAEAQYFIEKLPIVTSPGESLGVDTPVDDTGFYRITARGTGTSGGAAVILQSIYKR